MIPDSPSEDLSRFYLSDKEELLRHQLNLRSYWAQKTGNGEVIAEELGNSEILEIPAKWTLTNGIVLRDWQSDCIERWFQQGCKGIAKVVTGAGKTVLAMALTERLQNQQDPDLRVVVVVPTVVLMQQWQTTLLKYSNLPATAIGCLGGGNSDTLNNGVRILVAVLNSAATKLPEIGRSITHPLLLIVDECHRSGAQQMSKIYETPRSFTLGLSATPERDEAPDQDYLDEADLPPKEEFDESILGRELGPVIFEMDYRTAIESGILARFVLKHYGLPLTPEEKMKYERLSREISELRRSLQSQVRGRSINGGMLVGWARRAAARGGAMSEQAAAYVRSTGQRKLLLYNAKARSAAVSRLVNEAVANSSKIILFHESIAEVMQLFIQLMRDGHSVVVEHSKLSDSIRQESIRLFRDGSAQILVSARSLIEGFDAPAADVGIVVASSSSVRQRIQTLGRILRRKPGEEDRTAILHVLYMEGTTDEMIYEKENWEQFTGAERNQYAVWNPFIDDSLPISKDGPPRRPKPNEADIDWDMLNPGDEYPGNYEGEEYSTDSQGNVRTLDQSLIINPQDVPQLVSLHRASGSGRIRVTESKRAILIPAGNGKIIFGGFLHDVFNVGPANLAELDVGEDATILDVKSRADGLRFSLKVSSGEFFAKRCDTAADSDRGQDAEELAKALKKIQQEQGVTVRKVMLYSNLEVIAEIAGQQQLIWTLKKGLEFKDQTLP